MVVTVKTASRPEKKGKKGLKNACFGRELVQNGGTLRIGGNWLQSACLSVSRFPAYWQPIAEDFCYYEQESPF
jgi:hypothetical protein